MNVVQGCAAAIRRAGGTARLLRDGASMPFPARLQYRNNDDDPGMSPLGLGRDSYFTMFCVPPDGVKLEPGDVAEYGGHRYRVLRCEPFLFEGRPVYRWAVVRRETRTEGGGGDA